MEKTVKHRFLNSVVFTALIVSLAFFLLRDTIAAVTELMLRSAGGEDSFLYQINGDIARLVIGGLLMLILPIFFRGRCNFGFRGGRVKLGLLLALPQLAVPLWNLLQYKVYEVPLVTGTAILAAVVHGIGPGVSEEIFCRGFAVSNLMRIWKDKPDRILRCMLVSGAAFGLLHAVNLVAAEDVLAVVLQVVYTAAIGMMNAAVFLRSRSIWGVILTHTLTDVTAFLGVMDGKATGMDVAFCVVGSLLFAALASYLIRPAKREEIDALWADGWSFGAEDGKHHAGAKAAGIVAAVLGVTFAACIGVMLYQSKMGYDLPLFPAEEKPLDQEIHYQLSDDQREITLWLPYSGGESYQLQSSDPKSLVLQESWRDEENYYFILVHAGTDAGESTLTLARKLGDSPISIKDYTVIVRCSGDGTISAVVGG